MRVPGVNQGKRASRSANVHRLPEAIENQNLTVYQRIHMSILRRDSCLTCQTTENRAKLSLAFFAVNASTPVTVRCTDS